MSSPDLTSAPARGENSARGIIIAAAAIWVAAGLYVSALGTIIWLLGVALIVLFAMWWARWLDDRVYLRLLNGQCAHCGYDLRGAGTSSGDCPECGEWFGPGWGAAYPDQRQEGSFTPMPARDALAYWPEAKFIEPPDDDQALDRRWAAMGERDC